MRKHFQICQNNKTCHFENILIFAKEQMPSVIKMVPVLEASDRKAEIGVGRVLLAHLSCQMLSEACCKQQELHLI